jgi:hypothetical protein
MNMARSLEYPRGGKLVKRDESEYYKAGNGQRTHQNSRLVASNLKEKRPEQLTPCAILLQLLQET